MEVDAAAVDEVSDTAKNFCFLPFPQCAVSLRVTVAAQ
jgi:hypothetical protein